MMTLYPPLETGENHSLQHVAEVRFRLEKEQDFSASMYSSGTDAEPMLRMKLTQRFRWPAWAGLLLALDSCQHVAVGIGAGTIVCSCWELVENLLAGTFKRKLENASRSVS